MNNKNEGYLIPLNFFWHEKKYLPGLLNNAFPDPIARIL